MNTVVTTRYGRRFDLANPSPDDVHIEDIIYGLPRLPRFVGQNAHSDTINVAIHSVRVAFRAMELSADLGVRRTALGHDFVEAYTGDIPTPVKQMVPQIRDLERCIWKEAIAPAFGFHEEMPQIVLQADAEVLAYEATWSMPESFPVECHLPGWGEFVPYNEISSREALKNMVKTLGIWKW